MELIESNWMTYMLLKLHLFLYMSSQYTWCQWARDFCYLLLAFALDGRMDGMEIWCRLRMKFTLLAFLLLDGIQRCLLFHIVDFCKSDHIKLFVAFICLRWLR